MECEDKKLSCVDCGSAGCINGTGGYPPFCTTAALEAGELEEALELANQPENRKVLKTAARVEYEGYCRWTRIREIVEFARRMGYRKLGIAACVGLLHEARIAAGILRSHGFEVYGAACKAGAVRKTAVGIAPECESIGPNMCNPILQAKLLNKQGTELNIVVGLCVGHDSLFYKYSHALCTTLVTKDRVTGHNPAAALYTAESYYKSLYGPEKA